MAQLTLRLFIRAIPERVWDVISDLPGQSIGPKLCHTSG